MMAGEIDIRARALLQLRRHSHCLIEEAYRLLEPTRFATWKEPDITGELCRKMTVFMASCEAPSWVTHYAVHDDPKVNKPGKFGDARPRIDIEIERINRGERPRFRFEAKRLGKKHSISAYLGNDGMMALLNGHYPLTHPEAAMLGYFQNEDLAHWFTKISKEFKKDATKYQIVNGTFFAPHSLTKSLETRLSEHDSNPGSIRIWHTLLKFW